MKCQRCNDDEAEFTVSGERLCAWCAKNDYAVSIPTRSRVVNEWRCTNPACRASYAEYVNGCPKCVDELSDRSHSVVSISHDAQDELYSTIHMQDGTSVDIYATLCKGTPETGGKHCEIRFVGQSMTCVIVPLNNKGLSEMVNFLSDAREELENARTD